MGTYNGTYRYDTITPTTVSQGVTATPPGTKPSNANDTIAGTKQYIGANAFTGGDGMIDVRFDRAKEQIQVDVNDDGAFGAGDLEINDIVIFGGGDLIIA